MRLQPFILQIDRIGPLPVILSEAKDLRLQETALLPA